MFGQKGLCGDLFFSHNSNKGYKNVRNFVAVSLNNLAVLVIGKKEMKQIKKRGGIHMITFKLKHEENNLKLVSFFFF